MALDLFFLLNFCVPLPKSTLMICLNFYALQTFLLLMNSCIFWYFEHMKIVKLKIVNHLAAKSYLYQPSVTPKSILCSIIWWIFAVCMTQVTRWSSATSMLYCLSVASPPYLCCCPPPPVCSPQETSNTLCWQVTHHTALLHRVVILTTSLSIL